MTTDMLERAKRYVDELDARIDAAQESRSRGIPGSRAELKGYRALRDAFYEIFPELDGYGKKDADDAQREELRSAGHCDTPIGELELYESRLLGEGPYAPGEGPYASLLAEGIETIGDLLEETETGLRNVPGLSGIYRRSITDALAKRGLHLKELID